jgi:chemotaxis protein CheX
MKKEYLQPFLHATEKISNTFFDVAIQKSNISLEPALDLEKEVIIALGIKGSLSGIVLFGMNQEEAIKLSSHVLNLQGMPGYETWDELTQSVLLEFGNQVVGYVTQLYDKEGFKCDITTPSFIKTEQLKHYTKESVRFELTNEIATIVVKLHIQKK